MKFGVREICDVVLKAKATQKVGDKVFYKDEPVIYFDTLKTSSMEGAATSVYAQGGRGNSRLVAWEGERTVTFTMEDALISPAGFMILSGAGLVNATSNKTLKIHTTEQLQLDSTNYNSSTKVITLKAGANVYGGEDGSTENYIYIMKLDSEGEVTTEPILGVKGTNSNEIKVKTGDYTVDEESTLAIGDIILVDYYNEVSAGAQQIDITPDKFGGNYYLEASTLFRDTRGVDMPAEFIIPNCKIQSNFTFTMASSGDPSTFTFTIDAFPGYTRFDKTKKVLAAIQIISEVSEDNWSREATKTNRDIDDDGRVYEKATSEEEEDEE